LALRTVLRNQQHGQSGCPDSSTMPGGTVDCLAGYPATVRHLWGGRCGNAPSRAPAAVPAGPAAPGLLAPPDRMDPRYPAPGLSRPASPFLPGKLARPGSRRAGTLTAAEKLLPRLSGNPV